MDFKQILDDILESSDYPAAFLSYKGSFLAKSESFDPGCGKTNCPLPIIPLSAKYKIDLCQHGAHRLIFPIRFKTHLAGYFLVCQKGDSENFQNIAKVISNFLHHKIYWEVEKANLQHNLINRSKELELLYEVSNVFNSMFDVREASKSILAKITEVMEIDKGSIMLLNDNGELTIFASKGVPDEIANKAKVILGEGISGKVALSGEPLMSNKIENENYYENGKSFKQYRTGGFMSLPISLPIGQGERKVIGVMNLNDKLTNEDFNDDDLKLATAIASQAALSIENARTYQNLLSEKKKLETTIEGMSDGIVVTDAHHNIFLANETAISMFHISESDLAGQNLLTLLQDYSFSREIDHIKSTVQLNLKYEISISVPDYTVYNVKETKITDDSGRTVNIIIVFRNITDQKRQDTLKSEFLSLISHKFRTPLVGLIGYPQFLLDGSMGELNDTQRGAIKAIEQQSKQLNKLVDQLLRFAELEDKSLALHQEIHHLGELRARLLDYTRRSAESKNIRLTIEIPEDLPCVFINPEKIVEVFVNLIDNAIKFSPEKTQVKVIAFQKDENYIQIDVIDQGIGIDKKNIEKVFEKFYQVEQYFTGQVKGVGLGLAMVKYLIERHGGEIWVNSVPGKGSIFHFTLPTAPVCEEHLI